MKFKLSDILDSKDIKPDTEVEVDEAMLANVIFENWGCDVIENGIEISMAKDIAQALPKIIRKVGG